MNDVQSNECKTFYKGRVVWVSSTGDWFETFGRGIPLISFIIRYIKNNKMCLN